MPRNRIYSAATCLLLCAAFAAVADKPLAEPTKEVDKPAPIVNSIGMKLVAIPAGKFTMGSPADEKGRSDSETQHEVTLTKGFYIGATPVTQAQWKAVMGTEIKPHFEGDDLPMEQLTWDQAASYCQKLSAKEGKHYRLPTEAEWEYACRAGSTGPFAGTGKLDEMGWYEGNSEHKSHPVAQKKPNAWGLYDMHGNVAQWCSDWFGEYPKETPPADPQLPGNGSSRIIRGGTWMSNESGCRSANRGYLTPNSSDSSTGLRVCMDLP